MQALDMAAGPCATSAAAALGASIVLLAAVDDITTGGDSAAGASRRDIAAAASGAAAASLLEPNAASEPSASNAHGRAGQYLHDVGLLSASKTTSASASAAAAAAAATLLDPSQQQQRRVVSLSELEQHRTAEDAWVVVDGRVYDITPFLESHPGGHDVILEQLETKDVGDLMRGRPATHRRTGLLAKLSFQSDALTAAELHSHSKAAFKMLQQFLVGELQLDSGYDSSLWSNPSDALRNTAQQEAGISSKDDHAHESEVDLSRPIVCQVGRLGDRYNAWVHDPVITKEIPRFFESDFLEFFTQTKWWAVPLVWIPAIIALLLFGLHHGLPRKSVLPSIVIGLFVWTLLEYNLHRFLFHMRTTSYWGNTFHYVIHGFHHKHPMDGSRLVFPPAFAFVVASFFWAVIVLLRIPKGVGAGVLGGALVGYVCYDLTHYFLHFGTAFNETSRKMKRYHLNHHFKVQSQGFGVMTWTMWDRVFGTLPDGDEKGELSSSPSKTTKSHSR